MLYEYNIITTVVGVMKMGNIVPRVVIKTTSLAFGVSLLIITPPRLPDVTTIPMPTSLCSSFPRGQCRLLPSSSWNCEYFTFYNYIPYIYIYTHTKGRFNSHTMRCLYWIIIPHWLWDNCSREGINIVLERESNPHLLYFGSVC